MCCDCLGFWWNWFSFNKMRALNKVALSSKSQSIFPISFFFFFLSLSLSCVTMCIFLYVLCVQDELFILVICVFVLYLSFCFLIVCFICHAFFFYLFVHICLFVYCVDICMFVEDFSLCFCWSMMPRAMIQCQMFFSFSILHCMTQNGFLDSPISQKFIRQQSWSSWQPTLTSLIA